MKISAETKECQQYTADFEKTDKRRNSFQPSTIGGCSQLETWGIMVRASVYEQARVDSRLCPVRKTRIEHHDAVGRGSLSVTVKSTDSTNDTAR